MIFREIKNHALLVENLFEILSVLLRYGVHYRGNRCTKPATKLFHTPTAVSL